MMDMFSMSKEIVLISVGMAESSHLRAMMAIIGMAMDAQVPARLKHTFDALEDQSIFPLFVHI